MVDLPKDDLAPYKRLIHVSFIGKGSFGEVYKGCAS